ncbi:TRAP transporter small permease [Catenovulum sediminis]|nr:TRAP transporter small permease [Catenovulum sediminis]
MTDYKTSNSSNEPQNRAASAQIDFQHEDDTVFNYADYKFEDWIAFILFWILAVTVFSQFISRYVFSAPLGWTEEVARYQLICLGFMGGCIGVRRNTHIFVALFHRWMPTKLSTLLYQTIAVFNVIFITALAYFAWQIIPLLHIHKMASIPLPISVLYGVIFASLLIMLARSYQYLFNIISNPT